MKVSILVTTYNLEKYIATTLDSVLSQKTRHQFEVLVGDDGSSDKTRDIVYQYIAKYPDKIKLYTMPREEGVAYNRVERSSANRINLLKHASGDYASFLDGDDFYTDDSRIETMVDILEAEANKDCIMCAHNLYMYYENTYDKAEDCPPLCRAKKEHKWELKDYWPAIFIQANALLFRNVFKKKQYLEKITSDKAFSRNFDDNNITYFLFAFGNMYYLPTCMGAYRQVENSSWNGIDELKKHCSNMLGLNMEMNYGREMAKNVKDAERILDYSYARHLENMEYIYEHKDELTADRCSPFYQTAVDSNLFMASALYDYKNTGDHAMNTLPYFIKRGRKALSRFKAKRGLSKLLKKY